MNKKDIVEAVKAWNPATGYPRHLDMGIVNKTLLVAGKLYRWERDNWIPVERSTSRFVGASGAHIGPTLWADPRSVPAFVSVPALNRGPFPGGNWTTLGRIDIDSVSAWQLRPCAHAERQCTRTGERRCWRFGQERLVYCRCDERGYSS